MRILQPIQQFCDLFMSYLISASTLKWEKQSVYTDIDLYTGKQYWYEHVILFPIQGDYTEFCVELNYEPGLGLRLAFGIRKDKPKKRNYNKLLVDRFKKNFSPVCEAGNPYLPSEKKLDTDHWIVWKFLPLPLSITDFLKEEQLPETVDKEISHVVDKFIEELKKFLDSLEGRD